MNKSRLQCQILPAYLKGLAEQTFYSLTDEQTAIWSAVERALTDRFHSKESRQVHISTLRAKLRQPDTLNEALAAAKRYESNQKVMNKESTRVLSSTYR